MPLLKRIQKDFDKDIRSFYYKISLEDGREIYFNFKKEHLKHLLGIQYLSINYLPASIIYQDIKKKKLTLEKLKKQKGYSQIESRVLNFSRLKNLLTVDSIIEFDASKLKDCKLKSKFMLFDDSTGESLHLGLAKDGKYYPETWFIRKKDIDKYSKNQKRIKSIISKISK